MRSVPPAGALLLAVGLGRAAAGEPPVVEAVVQAPVSEVWRLFTTNEGLSSWMAPVVEIDLRIGGTLRTSYSREGKIGGLGTITKTILSYDPGRMLSFKESGVPAGTPSKEALESVWTVIYFEPAGEGRTRLTVVGLGYGEDAASLGLRELFRTGTAQTLEKLKSRVAAAAPAPVPPKAPADGR